MSKPVVIFMLGGPGSGKGTQSVKIQQNFKFVHLSAGDLLRAERKKQGSKNGQLIEKFIVQGKIVPSQITVALLKQAMERSGWENGKFLIDGFPRNHQNLGKWIQLMESKATTPFIMYLDCPEQAMEKRLLKRGETSGRTDDNKEAIMKRFITFKNQTIPVIDQFAKTDQVLKIDASKGEEQIFERIDEEFKKRGVA